MKLKYEGKPFNIIIDAYNGDSEKEPLTKMNFYGSLAKHIPNLYVVIVSSKPNRKAFSQIIGFHVDFITSTPLPLLETYLSLDRGSFDLISEEQTRYLNETEILDFLPHRKKNCSHRVNLILNVT